MSDPLGWPIWLQIPLLFVLITGAALEWFVTGYGGLLVIAFGLIVGAVSDVGIHTESTTELVYRRINGARL